ncbi:MAG: sigma-70 family RNA polymerase sigma factor [Candidatus Zixiibacteriota bacterium]
MTERTVPELVEAFASGDNRAFTELVGRYQKKVYSVAFQVVGNHLDADEVVQETFVRIYNRREELRAVQYFTSFVMRVATNYAIDLLRKRKGQDSLTTSTDDLPERVQLDLASRVSTPERDYRSQKIMAEIMQALDRLPPRQKLTAILHDVEGYTKSEIAEMMKCPEATVRSNLHIARTKLKKILEHRLVTKE